MVSLSLGNPVGGLLAALICKLAFTKAVLGFLLSAIFFAASIITQAIFVNRANHAVDDAGLSEEELSGFKRRMIRLAEQSVGLTVGCFGFVYPKEISDTGDRAAVLSARSCSQQWESPRFFLLVLGWISWGIRPLPCALRFKDGEYSDRGIIFFWYKGVTIPF